MDFTSIANGGFKYQPSTNKNEEMSLATINKRIVECTNKIKDIKFKVDEIKDQWNSLNEDYSIFSFADTLDPCIKENFQKAIDDLKTEYEDAKSTLQYFKDLKNKTLLESGINDIGITEDKVKEIEDMIPFVEEHLQNGAPSDALEIIFSKYVPKKGKSDTVGGELARAMMKLLYSGYKANEVFYDSIGSEKLGSYVQYLMNHGFTDTIYNISDYQYVGDEYLQALEGLCKEVVQFIIDNSNILAEVNTEDSSKTVIGDFGDITAKQTVEYELSPELIEMIDKGKTNETEIISSIRATFDEFISEETPIGCDFFKIRIDDLNKNNFDEVAANMKSWEDGFILSVKENP